MKTNYRQRDVRFEVLDGCLVRTVVDTTPGSGGAKAYQHRCTRKAFETIAHAIGETPGSGEGTSLAEIVKREDLPFTQVNVALEFLKERGIVDVRGRRCYPAAITTFEDAMTEFTYLADVPY